MNEELEKKVKKLSWYSLYVGNQDIDNPHRMSGVIEGVLDFTRKEILDVCDDIYSFVIYGLSKAGKSEEVIDFMEEFLNSKFGYKKSTCNTVRFIHFANYYMNKFEKDFVDTPFEIGNTFLREQIK